jgi:hypothetical protein
MEEYGTFAQYSFNPREDESEKGAMTLSITTLSKIEKKHRNSAEFKSFIFYVACRYAECLSTMKNPPSKTIEKL